MTKPLFDPDGFARNFRVRLAERQMNMRQAAKEIGISLATVSRVSRGFAPDVENYLRIERWMNKKLTAPRVPMHSD